MKRRHKVILASLIIASLIVALLLFLPSRQTTPGVDFVKDLILGYEDKVWYELSTDFQNVVRAECPGGAATACVHDLIQSEWGQLKDVVFVIGSGSRNTVLYYAFWSELSHPVSIVLMYSEENGSEAIKGWRGFVVSEGENEDSRLLMGGRHDNELSAS